MVRKFIRGGLSAAILIAASLSAHAESSWPDKPIRFVVASSTGGALSTTTRIYADALAKVFNQPIIVEDKPGAGGIIAADTVARTKPDGYTLLSGANGVITNSMLRAQMPYAESDLIPVALLDAVPAVLIADPLLNIHNIKELQAYARSHPGGITYGTAGPGSSGHFVAIMLQKALGVPITLVPFKGPSPAALAVAGGQITLASGAGLSVLPLITSKKVIAIATTGDKRWRMLPNVATTEEAGFPAVRLLQWGGLFAPKGTPVAILDRLSREILALSGNKEFRARMEVTGADLAFHMKRAEFDTYLQNQRETLGKIARDNNMKEE